MQHRNLISFSALSLFVFLAFGSTPGVIEQLEQSSTSGGTLGNKAACQAWVEHSNSLPCYPVNFDASEMCPASLDMTPIDMSSYYHCMIEGTRCNGNIPDLSEAGECAMPTQ